MNKEVKEIIEHLKEYLQSKIDNGEHKIFYNDLMWDIKTIDCINAIDNLLDCITSLEQRIDKAISKIDEVFAEEDWYENYEYNDLEDVLIEVKEILQGSNKE